MDFDLKIYFPLVAACITSTVALLLGVFNYRTNIKIKNQQLLVRELEKEVMILLEIRKALIADYLNCSEIVHTIYEKFHDVLIRKKDIYTIKSLLEIINHNVILKELKSWELIFATLEDFSYFETTMNMNEIILRYKANFTKLLNSFDNEITFKQSEIKDLYKK